MTRKNDTSARAKFVRRYFPVRRCASMRVEEGDAGEPGNQRGILHRIPSPVPAPAEDAVRPVGAQHDAEPEHGRRAQDPREAPVRRECRISVFQSPAIARLNGAAIAANPRKRTGGWMTIQKFCRSGLRPRPSAGMASGASGNISQTERKGDFTTTRSNEDRLHRHEHRHDGRLVCSCRRAAALRSKAMTPQQSAQKRKLPSCPA